MGSCRNADAGRSSSSWVERTTNPLAASLQHVRVAHRRTDVFMAQEFLDGPDIIAIFQQMGSKRMPARIATLLIARQYFRSVTPTIPLSDRRLNWSEGFASRPQTVS
jgi:hypothetical protein